MSIVDGYGLSLKQLESIADESVISGKQLFKDISEQFISLFNDITFKGSNVNKILQEINLKQIHVLNTAILALKDHQTLKKLNLTVIIEIGINQFLLKFIKLQMLNKV